MARTIAALLLAGRAATGQPVGLTLDLYHAVSAATSGFLWQDINPAGIMGVLKYIHTEVIAEHEVSPPDRRGRKDDLQAIARATFKVRNPTAMPDVLRHLIDFGPFMHFEGGRTFDAYGLDKMARHGEFVGIQKQTDVRFPTKEPYYWFSLAGPCPNLPYEEKTGGISPRCLQYNEASVGAPGPVVGGLCPGGGGLRASVEPTGAPGCTYSYGEVSSVSLDELVGITREDCGGRRCRDWWDFRQSCTNPAYRWMFDGHGNNVSAGFCVEYDIHPKCASDCGSEACKTVPEPLREAGLPFWRGRCDPEANQMRAEKLAEAFGIPGANSSHRLVSKQVRDEFRTCVHEVPGTCAPAEGQGGMYCTRDWAGVCQPCYIPGTRELWPAREFMPTCPYSVLKSPDYKDRFPPPSCKSDRPSDQCCLYLGTCSLSEANPELLPLDDEGYASAASLQDTAAMVAFLGRVRGLDGRPASEAAPGAALRAFAYRQWDDSPVKARSFESTKAEMFKLGLVSSSTPPPPTTTTAAPTVARTTTTTTTTSTRPQTTVAPQPAAAATTTVRAPVVVLPVTGNGTKHHDLPSNPYGHNNNQPAMPQALGHSKSNWWMWVLLGVAALPMLVGIAALIYIRRRRKSQADSRSAGGVGAVDFDGVADVDGAEGAGAEPEEGRSPA